MDFYLTADMTLLHEPERAGSLKIRKFWLLWSDVMVFSLRFHSRNVSIGLF